MLPTDHLPAFLLTVYVLILIPGPSVLFVISRGVALGRRAALATVLGNETGFMLQLTLVAIGVGSLVPLSDAVFSALRLIGAAYLVLLGVRKIRERKSLAEFGAAAATPRALGRIYREGFYVGGTHPQGAGDLHRGPAAVRRSLAGPRHRAARGARPDLHRDRRPVGRHLGVCL